MGKSGRDGERDQNVLSGVFFHPCSIFSGSRGVAYGQRLMGKGDTQLRASREAASPEHWAEELKAPTPPPYQAGQASAPPPLDSVGWATWLRNHSIDISEFHMLLLSWFAFDVGSCLSIPGWSWTLAMASSSSSSYHSIPCSCAVTPSLGLWSPAWILCSENCKIMEFHDCSCFPVNHSSFNIQEFGINTVLPANKLPDFAPEEDLHYNIDLKNR